MVYHTHGLAQYNNGLELELNAGLSMKDAGTILNTIGFALAEGRVELHDGMYEGTLFTMPLHYMAVKSIDNDGTILRVVLPDVNGKFPWGAGCDSLFATQVLPEEK